MRRLLHSFTQGHPFTFGLGGWAEGGLQLLRQLLVQLKGGGGLGVGAGRRGRGAAHLGHLRMWFAHMSTLNVNWRQVLNPNEVIHRADRPCIAPRHTMAVHCV